MIKRTFAAIIVIVLLPGVRVYAEDAVYHSPGKAAIASAHPLATSAGFEVLAKGGNVFDAAVAVSAALAVVEPSSSGLGGGGYWLLHRAEDGYETMIDGREKAPLSASENMYLDKEGNVILKKSVEGPLAAGIPGMPAAIVHLSEKYGRLPLAESLSPAIRYAKYGFAVGHKLANALKRKAGLIRKYPHTAAIFLNKGKIPKPYSILRQPALAKTLELLANNGKDGFYAGRTAKRLIEGVYRAGGLWTPEDLDAYRVIERQPVKGRYRGITITSAAPSSAGGMVLIEALNVLTGYDLSENDSIIRKHLIVEAMRRSYHDRALYLGDPDFIPIPVRRLLSADYAAGLRSSLRLDKALPSNMLSGQIEEMPKAVHTTHFSIIDDDGNRVAATMSINTSFGSGFVAEGTGVLLNNEMNDFSSKPGAMNTYGLTGGAANAIEPGKRMLSSMTPTFLEDGERIAVLGTPGGSRITSMVLLAVLNFSEGHGPDSWVTLPRFHHQYLPDVIEYEPGAITARERVGLESMGHHLKELNERYGNMQAAQLNKSTHALSAASDPRGEGLSRVASISIVVD